MSTEKPTMREALERLIAQHAFIEDGHLERIARNALLPTEGRSGLSSQEAADILRARAALAAEEKSGWRAIEAAPKDGTRVLLKFPPPFNDLTELGATVGMWTGGGWWLSCIWAVSSAHRDPIAWAPLPSPPASQDEKP